MIISFFFTVTNNLHTTRGARCQTFFTRVELKEYGSCPGAKIYFALTYMISSMWWWFCLLFTRPFPNLHPQLISLSTLKFSTLHALNGVISRNHPTAFFYAPWFDSRYVLDDNTIVPYACSDHLLDNIHLIALNWDGFRLHICAVDNELENPKLGHSSAQERFVHACGVQWELLGGRGLLPAAAGFDLSFARSEDDFTFFCWLVLPSEEDAPRFGDEFFHHVARHLQRVLIIPRRGVRMAIISNGLLKCFEAFSVCLETISFIRTSCSWPIIIHSIVQMCRDLFTHPDCSSMSLWAAALEVGIN